jgi:hypothetical protein
MRKHCFLQQTSHPLKCNFKTFRKYSHRRDSLDIGGPTDLWAFTSNLPHSYMKLIGLVQDFWHESTRPSSNRNDVLKLRRGSRDHELHINHFLDITQIELYERFITVHSALNLGQRYFHKFKPWHVRINTIRNTCCCRYHKFEYGYHYDTHTHTHTRCILHKTLLQECSVVLSPSSSRYFIHRILCTRLEGFTFYQKQFLDGTCPKCCGMKLLSK